MTYFSMTNSDRNGLERPNQFQQEIKNSFNYQNAKKKQNKPTRDTFKRETFF